ncbi:MAG: PQQ-dependent sugar dehydrogenase [Pseudomonadales bacterium]
MRILKPLLIALLLLAVSGVAAVWYLMTYAELDEYVALYDDSCAQCHGADLKGTPRGPALLDTTLSYGDSVAELQGSISERHTTNFSSSLTDIEIKGLAIFLGERRLGLRFSDFRFERQVNIPGNVQVSEQHNFKIETLIDNLAPLVFSIEPLPNGSLLLTEKERGLSIVSADGTQSSIVDGTPKTGGSINMRGVQYGAGWLLDLALHPNYEENGWVYLHYTQLCGKQCDSILPLPHSMNRLDRGRIKNGKWVDVENIWRTSFEFYEPTPDTGAGGRIAFDDSGHVYVSVGIKSADLERDTTPQHLGKPYGKIHRVRDDGSVPTDNPFVVEIPGDKTSNAPTINTIWTYGHRSPQGLEWNPVRKQVWNSEMGARGGDEINELLPGRNYGWPYHSNGLEYSGPAVERHKLEAVEFDVGETEQTLVDITPSPAISSFVFYAGERFPRWKNNVLIGSLKGSSLYRMVFDGNKLIHQETLINDLARIRDIEVGYDGLVYLLLENKAGSSIVRLVPENS